MEKEAGPTPSCYKPDKFIVATRKIMERGNRRHPAWTQYFVQVFGARPSVRSTVWMYIRDSLETEAMPKNSMWPLLLLKVYATEGVSEYLTGYRRDTFADGRR